MISTISSFFKQLRRPSMALFAMAGMIVTGAACDYNIEVFPVKKKLEKIEGVARCENANRLKKGNSGQVSLRIFLVDQNNESIMPDENNPLDLSKLSISSEGSFVPTVIDADDGTVVSGASVKLNIVTNGAEPLKRVINPQYETILNSVRPNRVPNAVSLLIDMSETAANQDNALSRTSATAGWILDEEYFNADSARGFLDIFQEILVRGNRLSPDDDLFKGKKDADNKPINYIPSSGRPSSFLITNEDNKDMISSENTNTSNSRAREFPPLYDAITASAQNLRSVAYDATNTPAMLFNPMSIAISLERDVNAVNKKPTSLNRALAAIKDANSFMPVTTIVYPKPSGTADADWSKHKDDLCTLAQKGGTNRNDYFGHVIPILPENRGRSNESAQDYQAMVRQALNMAFHSMKGFHELKVSYTLSGVKAGKRYYVEFSLQGEWLNEKSDPKNSARIIFEVQP